MLPRYARNHTGGMANTADPLQTAKSCLIRGFIVSRLFCLNFMGYYGTPYSLLAYSVTQRVHLIASVASIFTRLKFGHYGKIRTTQIFLGCSLNKSTVFIVFNGPEALHFTKGGCYLEPNM